MRQRMPLDDFAPLMEVVLLSAQIAAEGRLGR